MSVIVSAGRGPKIEVARSDESIQAPEESREVEDTSRTGGSASVKVEVATEPVGVAPEESWWEPWQTRKIPPNAHFFSFWSLQVPRRPQSCNPMCFLLFKGVAMAGADCFDFVGWSLGCSVGWFLSLASVSMYHWFRVILGICRKVGS